MSVVISSYQTGRPKVEVATAIKHLRICQRAHSPSIGARVQTASLARADDNRITRAGRRLEQAHPVRRPLLALALRLLHRHDLTLRLLDQPELQVAVHQLVPGWD